MILFGLLFIVYLVNTQRLYWKNRNRITEEFNKKMIRFEFLLLILAVISLIYGLYDYVNYKMNNLGPRFNWHKFFLSARECSFDAGKDIYLKK